MFSSPRVLLILALCSGFIVVNGDEREYYSDKFDNLDVDAILQNDVLRDEYYGCFMDTNPCTNEAASFFKANIPEAIVTQCRKCTDRQLDMFGVAVEWFVANREDDFRALMKKFIADARRAGLTNENPEITS